ncbi:hypothetical protein DFH28DRAFT_1159514 [Melampsora americana]|nr:hypothetical protein DFH28DRAFT_1159514 [Melampsora americana]
MSSQPARVSPYPTPKNRRHLTNGSPSALRSIQGVENSQVTRAHTSSSGSLTGVADDLADENGRPILTPRLVESVTAPDTLLLAKVLAAVNNLSNKLECEMTRVCNKIDGELACLGKKLDDKLCDKLDILDAQITGKIDASQLSLSDQIDVAKTTLSNKINVLSEENIALGPPNQHQQAGGNSATVTTTQAWAYSPELRDRVYVFAYESVCEPTIAAYTALESPNGDVLVHLLFNTIKQKINGIPVPWPSQQLPPVVNGIQEVAATQRYNTLVRDAGKHAREKLHHLGTVPSIKRLVHCIATHCPKNPGIVPDMAALWNATEWPHCLRIAYLRREAVRNFQELRAGRSGGNIWRRVDSQLGKMSDKGPTYTAAFYKLIYKEDCHFFDGTRRFEEFDTDMNFDLPLEELIEDEMQRMEEGTNGLE